MDRLADHVDLLTGFPFKSASYTLDDSGTRLVRGDNVVQGRLRWDNAARWQNDQEGGIERYLLEPGDVVLAMDRPWIEAGLKYARIGEDDVPSLLVQRVARLRAHSELHQGFLYYLIGSRAFTDHVLAVQTGTAVPHISGKQILEFQFRLPPYSEQEAIAAVLGSLDDKIEQNRRTARALERLARAIFKAWFVDFEPVKTKAAGAASFPSMPQEIFDALPTAFEDSEIGPVPQGWQPRKLGEIYKLDKGLSYKGKHLTDEGRPMINLGCFLGGGRFNVKKLKPYSGDHKPRHLVEPGTLVMANTDMTQKRVILGSPAIVEDWGGEKPYLFTHHVFAARPVDVESSKWIPFTLYLLMQPSFRDRAEGFATGTTVLALPRDAVEACDFIFPQESFRDAFYETLEPIRSLLSSNRLETRKLADLRDYLLPRLVSGRLKVGT